MFNRLRFNVGYQQASDVIIINLISNSNINITATIEYQKFELNANTSINVIPTKTIYSNKELNATSDININPRIIKDSSAILASYTSSISDSEINRLFVVHLTSESDIDISANAIKVGNIDQIITSGIDVSLSVILSSQIHVNIETSAYIYPTKVLHFSQNSDVVSDLLINTVIVKSSESHINSNSNIKLKIEHTISEVFDLDVRSIDAKIELFINGNDDAPETFFKSDIINIELLEELKSDESNLLGNISSNVLNFSLYNENDRFNLTNMNSPYYGKLKTGIKVKSYIGAVLSNETVFTQLGTFYIDDFLINHGDIQCKVICYDKLYKLKDYEIPNIRLLYNATLGYLFELIFRMVNLNSNEYFIDPQLYNIVLKVAWLPQGKFKDVIQKLSEAACSSVYIDRNEIIQVKIIDLNGLYLKEINDKNQIIEVSSNMSFKNIYSKVNIYKYSPSLGEIQEVSRLLAYDVEPGITILDKQNFDESPVAEVNRVEVLNSDTVEVTSINSSVWDININLNNFGQSVNELDLIVYGNIIKDGKRLVSTNNNNVIEERIFQIDNHLIQDEEYARDYADTIFKIASKPDIDIDINVKGNPFIYLGMILLVNDNQSKVIDQKVFVVRSSLYYDGALSGSIYGYKIL